MAGNVHIIVGEDELIVGETAKKFFGDGTGVETFDALEATNADAQLALIDRVADSFRTPPFLDPQKVTWWKNVGFLPNGGKKVLADEVKERLEAFAKEIAASRLPENQQFVITAPALLKTSVFAKTLAATCEFIVFEKRKPNDAKRDAVVRAMDSASGFGLRFADGAAEHFIDTVGTDTRCLLSELSKLRDFLGERTEITHGDVEAVCSRGIGMEPVSWNVTDAITARDVDRVLSAMGEFKGESGYEVHMATVISSHFRQLAELKDAAKSGREGEVKGFMPWKLASTLKQLKRWTIGELRTASFRFLNLRADIVQGQPNGAELLEIELVRACKGMK